MAREHLSVRLWRRVEFDCVGGCWLWSGVTNGIGYGMLTDRTPDNPGRKVLAHRLSWEIAKGPIPPGLCVLHRCDTPQCVNPDHLFLGTHKTNSDDKIAKGRFRHWRPVGEANPRAKLDARRVREMRCLARSLPRRAIAQRFGLSLAATAKAITRKTWAHVR